VSSLDVSDLLSDPDVAGVGFSVIRRKETVGNNGRPTLTTTQTDNLSGAVYPSGDNSLTREEAFSTQTNSITVVTKFRLRGAGKDANGDTYQPDIVLYAGDHFLVRVVNDFTKFGAGFVEAECVGTDYQSTAPA